MGIAIGVVVGLLVISSCIWRLGQIKHVEHVEDEFESEPRYCTCGSTLVIDHVQPASFRVTCANEQHPHRAIWPLTVLFNHECDPDDLVPMGTSYLDDVHTIQPMRCVVCGKGDERAVEGPGYQGVI
jgi:hypothetical protein